MRKIGGMVAFTMLFRFAQCLRQAHFVKGIQTLKLSSPQRAESPQRRYLLSTARLFGTDSSHSSAINPSLADSISLNKDGSSGILKQPSKPVKPPKIVPKTRLPYKTYVSSEGLEIRVGRTAADNDVLSLDRTHRDDSDWWLHADGCPGSHVVIRCHDDDFPTVHPATLVEAALLAVVNSKKYSPQCGRTQVTLTRCSHVHKVAGSKAGTVHLFPQRGVRSVTVDIKKEVHRLAELEKTRK